MDGRIGAGQVMLEYLTRTGQTGAMITHSARTPEIADTSLSAKTRFDGSCRNVGIKIWTWKVNWSTMTIESQ